MEHLIAKVSLQTGIQEEKVQEVVVAVATYVKGKYPLLSATVDMVLELQHSSVES